LTHIREESRLKLFLARARYTSADFVAHAGIPTYMDRMMGLIGMYESAISS
jgi:hypothetical protein